MKGMVLWTFMLRVKKKRIFASNSLTRPLGNVSGESQFLGSYHFFKAEFLKKMLRYAGEPLLSLSGCNVSFGIYLSKFRTIFSFCSMAQVAHFWGWSAWVTHWINTALSKILLYCLLWIIQTKKLQTLQHSGRIIKCTLIHLLCWIVVYVQI